MKTPASAFAWELWQRHRKALCVMAGLLLAFTLFYPSLCRWEKFDPANPDPLAEAARLIPNVRPSLLWIIQMVYIGFLLIGPMAAQLISLIYLAWMFCYVAPDPKTKTLVFPARIFNLPVSTWFIYLTLSPGGIVSILLWMAGWRWALTTPDMGQVLSILYDPLLWLTLLTVGQAILWMSAGNFSTMAALAFFACMMFAPGIQEHFDLQRALPWLCLLGLVLSRVALTLTRQGRSPRWPRAWTLRKGAAKMTGPKHFASPALAQLWMEWRRSTRPQCLMVAVLTSIPIFVYIILREIYGWPPMRQDSVDAFAVFLALLPLLVYFVAGMSPQRNELPFLLNRPLTTGQMAVATLTMTALSALISSLIVYAAIRSLSLFTEGDAVAQITPAGGNLFLVMGPLYVLANWRFVAANLGFVWSGNRRLMSLPALAVLFYFLGLVGTSFFASAYEEEFEVWWKALPLFLGALIVVKFILAAMAFSIALKRRLISLPTVLAYAVIWLLLVALVITTAVFCPGQRVNDPLQLTLALVLLVPLARIGFCPIALSWQRHA